MGLFFRRERYQEEPVEIKPLTLIECIEKRIITLNDFKEEQEFLSIAKLTYHGVCELKNSVGFRYDEDRVKCLSDVYNGEKVSIYCTEKGFLLLYIDGKLKIKANLEDYSDVYNALCDYKYGIILKRFFYSKIKKNKNEKWIRDIEKSINNYNSFRNNSSVTKSNSSYTKSSSNVVKSNSSVVKNESNVVKSESNNTEINSNDDKSSSDSPNNDSSFNEKYFYSKLFDLCCEGSKACEELFNLKCSTAVITKNGKFICVNEKRIIEISDSKLKNLFSIKIDDLETLYSVLINSEYGEDLKEFLETNINKIKK